MYQNNIRYDQELGKSLTDFSRREMPFYRVSEVTKSMPFVSVTKFDTNLITNLADKGAQTTIRIQTNSKRTSDKSEA